MQAEETCTYFVVQTHLCVNVLDRVGMVQRGIGGGGQ